MLDFAGLPHMDQLGNFENGIETYQALPGKKGPIIVLPCQAKVLKNSKAQERFRTSCQNLRKWDVRAQTCEWSILRAKGHGSAQ